MEINQLLLDFQVANSEHKQLTERSNTISETRKLLQNEINQKRRILEELKAELTVSTDQKESSKMKLDFIRDEIENEAERFRTEANTIKDLTKTIFKNLGLKIWMEPLADDEGTWEIKVFFSESSKYFVTLHYFVPSSEFTCK